MAKDAKTLNGRAIVGLDIYRGSVANPKEIDPVHGYPVVLLPLYGAIPNKAILSAYIAHNSDLTTVDDDGNVALNHSNIMVNFYEKPESPENGRQFGFTIAKRDLDVDLNDEAYFERFGVGRLVDVLNDVEKERAAARKAEASANFEG